jgi:hypothetical protein
MKPLNVQQLLASGAMTGPHKRLKPVTLNPLQRLLRTVRVFLTNRQQPPKA